MDALIRTAGNLCMMDVFTYADLRIKVVTHNVAQKKPEGQPLKFIVDIPESTDEAKGPPDIFVVGIQEMKSKAHNLIIDAIVNDPWTNAFREELEPFGYVRVKTVRLLTMGLSLYCLRKHLPHIRGLEFSSEKTGALGFWGNKGGIALRLKIYGAKICFVNSHFHAHDNNLQDRIEDYNYIAVMDFVKTKTLKIFQHDYVFWFGDLNFRLDNNLTPEEIVHELNKGNIETLLAADQLRAAKKSEEAFVELEEPKIDFKPTYKYLVNSSDYDLTRKPAWCDRILYSATNENPEKKDFIVKVLSYKSIDNYTVSDHRPVTALFSITVFHNFKVESVEFLPMPLWYKEKENTASIIFKQNYDLRKNDWIGIYTDDFSSLSDYVFYKYVIHLCSDALASESPDRNDPLHLSFSEDDMSNLQFRKYVLVYHNEQDEVMGMSSSFELLPHKDRRGSYRTLDC